MLSLEVDLPDLIQAFWDVFLSVSCPLSSLQLSSVVLGFGPGWVDGKGWTLAHWVGVEIL